MSKYKVGDKVRIVSEWNEKTMEAAFGSMDKWLGKVMTIREVWTDYGRAVYKMEEDKNDVTNGWVWNEACIAGLANEKKIVITTDGKTTTAKMYDGKSCIKVSEARCCPSDTFDFQTGAEIAFDRIFEKSGFWGEFKAGKLCVKVDEENMPEFLKSCEIHGIKWITGKNATEINPFKELVRIFGFPVYEKYAYLFVADGGMVHFERNAKGLKEVEFSPEQFDWDAFKSHKLAVEVTKENIESFLSEAEKHGCKWRCGKKPTELNPNHFLIADKIYLYGIKYFDTFGVFGFNTIRTNLLKVEGYTVVEW